jgi:nucleotide-binding universal stress UspA family protein
MPQIATVLCPTDFSDPSRHALEHAIAIARWYGARIVGLHAYAPPFYPMTDLVTAGMGVPEPEPSTLAAAAEEVRASLEPARAVGVATDTRVASKAAATAILDCAAAMPADLIVMGTHGTSGFEHLLLGSVTEKVLRRATCPVMTVPARARATSRLPFAHIVCPVDFSASSDAALAFAFSLAQEANAELSLLHVLEWANDQPLSHLKYIAPEYHAYREQDAHERLAGLVPDEVRNWCAPTVHVAHGKPHDEILAFAVRQHADLVVMGVQGRNAVDVMLFGSTTNQVVRRATCPVLTLRS